jgi:hypothetical protein
VGHNIPFAPTYRKGFQHRVFETLQTFRSGDTRSSKLYTSLVALISPGIYFLIFLSFVAARSWDDIYNATINALKDSSQDDMVEIVHRSQEKSSHRPPIGIRRIIYSKMTDLRQQAGGISVSALNPEAAPFLPQVNKEPAEPPAHNYEQDPTVVPENVEDDMVHGQTTDTEDTAHEIPEVETKEWTEKETIAAIMIQKTWIAYRKRCEPQEDALEHKLSIVFVSCLKEARKVRNGLYKKLFLGPLPHVLLWLQEVEQIMYMAKAETKRLLHDTKTTPEEYERLDEQLTKNKYVRLVS